MMKGNKEATFQFIRYLFSGGSTYVLYVGTLYFFLYALDIEYLFSFLLSFFIANIYNYLAHYFFTFSSKQKHIIALRNFTLVVFLGTFLGAALGQAIGNLWPSYVFISGVVYGILWPLLSFFLLKKKVFLLSTHSQSG